MTDKKKPTLSLSLARRITPKERRLVRQMMAELKPHQCDNLPKQEQILEYIQSRVELTELQRGLKVVRARAVEMPEDVDAIQNLSTWMTMAAKVDTKLRQLRVTIGMTARKETDLKKAVEVKGSPKGGHQIKPWDDMK